jgi:hypothetical protein
VTPLANVAPLTEAQLSLHHNHGVTFSPSPNDPAPRGPATGWSTWPQAAGLVLTGATFRPAFPVALVVGTLLCAVNQGSALVDGSIDVVTALRMVANYAIPYLVSSVGFLSAYRDRGAGTTRR